MLRFPRYAKKNSVSRKKFWGGERTLFFAAARRQHTTDMGAAASVQNEQDTNLLKIATLKDLPDAIDVACFQFERHPLILDDAQGNADDFFDIMGAFCM